VTRQRTGYSADLVYVGEY